MTLIPNADAAKVCGVNALTHCGCNRRNNVRIDYLPNVMMVGVLVALNITPGGYPKKYTIQVVTPSGLNCTMGKASSQIHNMHGINV